MDAASSGTPVHADLPETVACSAGQVGELYDPLGAHSQDPFAFYALARGREPVFYSQRMDMWCVTRYDDICAVLRDPETFSAKGEVAMPWEYPPEVAQIVAQRRPLQSLNYMDAPEHTRARQVTAQGFAPARVAARAPMIREVADDLIDRMGTGPADVIGQFALPLPMTVILRMLGVPLRDLEACRAWCQDLTFVGMPLYSVEEQCTKARSVNAFKDYCQSLAEQRAADPQDDLLSHFVTAGVNGHAPLSVEEAADLMPAFIIAGHETTANFIANTLWSLLTHPDQLARVRARPELVPSLVEEGLRHDAPVVGFIRTALRDVEIGGVPIPAGTKLFLLYNSGNRDEDRFPDAEKFDIGRDTGVPHLGFGRGSHFCLGAPLARLEARVAFEQLLRRLPRLRLADPSATPTRTVSHVFRGIDQLLVAWG